MLIVRVELHSAITGKVSEIARMEIVNDGTSPSPKVGDYKGATIKGRSRESLDQSAWSEVHNRRGSVKGYRRLDLHVWNLVARMLKDMKYG